MRRLRAVGAACVGALILASGETAAGAEIASDRPAALVIYPSVKVGRVGSGQDTSIRLVNANPTAPILLACFYLDTDSHCLGGAQDGAICTGAAQICTGGTCKAGWSERDFRIQLTAGQPIEWTASVGLASPPIPAGVCDQNPARKCGTDADCSPYGAGACTQSNVGTRIPPVAEQPFTGELRCWAIDVNGVPIARNDLTGVAVIETATTTGLDVASYDAIGVPATGHFDSKPNQLALGGSSPEYGGCPGYLSLDHFFDGAADPVPGTTDTIVTNVVLVTCTDNMLTQKSGQAIVQYLVYNEFEQRFSTSNSVKGLKDVQLCKIDTSECTQSIWNVAVSGTLTGQTMILPLTVGTQHSGLVGIAVEKHSGKTTRTAAFNLHFRGDRGVADTITFP